MERLIDFYCNIDRAETRSRSRGARGVMSGRTVEQGTMGFGESQIGYLANESD
jgi:hypothetical protein